MRNKILALCGGIGGSKLAFGLSKVLSSEELFFLVNTGDDFIHYNLKICPDLDTLMYTLAGINDRTKGWGLQNERIEIICEDSVFCCAYFGFSRLARTVLQRPFAYLA